MTTYSEGNYIGDVVKYEVQEYSRESVTIKSGSGKLKAGAVLEIDSSTGKYQPLSFTAASGTGQSATAAVYGTPAAVLIKDVDATSADVAGLVVARHAIVAENKLKYSFDDETAIAKAKSGLAALGIVARKGE
ncbi:MAG: head decoration protein [Alphaproteobacteria bacterium]|nr:head decoration protein [Alphaproteobacteria bacterium]